MSIHASRVTKTIPIPFDPPHEATIQKLSGKHLDKAAQAYVASIFDGVKARGGAQVVKEMQQLFARPDAAQEIDALRADPLNGLDKHTVIKGGLKAWTYTDVPVTPEAIDDLDPEAVDYLATEIMRLTKPSLFQTADEREADQKNG